jgi:hypothetical protein
MFCPECHAEYREGFTRCADCSVALVHKPSRVKGQTQSIPSRHFVIWFPAMVVYHLLFFHMWFSRNPMENRILTVLTILFVMASNIGGFWMMYQSIRYEKDVKRYFFLAFIPVMFLWYYLERYQYRNKSEQTPVAFR